MIIRSSQLRDIDEILDIHFSTYDPKELSVVLGRDVTRKFYSLAIQSEYSQLLVVVSDNEVIAFTTAFSNINKFNRRFKVESLRLVFYRVLKLFFTANLRHLFRLLSSVFMQYSFLPKSLSNRHMGNMAIKKSYQKTPLALINFSKMFDMQINYLKENGQGFWTSAFKNNYKSCGWIRSTIAPESFVEKRVGDQDVLFFIKN